MKKRTYLTTLLLFLFFFNTAILTISTMLLNERIDTYKARGLAEHFVIASSLTRDIRALENRKIDVDTSINDLLRSYDYFSQSKKTHLLIFKGEQQVDSKISDKEIPEPTLILTEPEANQDRRVSIRGKDAPFLWISGRLPEPYQEYSLVYRYDLEDAFTSWQKTKNLLYLCSGVFTVLLALCLILLLNRIFRPLGQIAHASQSIAAGNYKDRLPLAGRDELYEMSHSFNYMAAEIERQIEALHEAAQQKQRFVDSFAHELRTPLTTIYGYAEYMQKTVLTEADKVESTAYIMKECKRLESMAYQLLDLAMLRSGEIKFEHISVAGLFRHVQKSIQAKAAAKQIQVTYETELDRLYGSQDLLESLLMNLIDNALKACDDNGRILVSAFLEGQTPILVVQDDGKGMTAEELAQAREAFYRADKARSREDGGVGLGLSLCEQIAQLHRAELQLHSLPGAGTTVRLSFTTP